MDRQEMVNHILMPYFKRNNIQVKRSKNKDKLANGSSYFSPSENEVMIRENECLFEKDLYFLSEAFHEAVHSTGPIVNRPFGTNDEEYAFEELVAETGATLLLLEKLDMDNFEKYLLHSKQVAYLSCYKDRCKSLFNYDKIMQFAKQAVKCILGGNN